MCEQFLDKRCGIQVKCWLDDCYFTGSCSYICVAGLYIYWSL